MALTASQSATLQTAIDNLNKSVAVNEEVLNIVKSIGNTGIVDISLHDNNVDAHPEFNNVFAKTNLFVGAKTFSPDGSVIGSVRAQVQNDGTNGAGVLETYGYTNGNSNFCGTIRFNYVHPASQTGLLSAGQIYARKYNSSTEGYDTTHSLVFTTNNLGKRSAYLGIVDTDVTQQFNFNTTRFYAISTLDLGSSLYQFKDAYLQNSPIVSSDERLKQDIEEIPEAVFRAWSRVNIKQYRFREAVTTKGDSARKHVGVIAQQILAAFEAEGLDATKYGIVCHDEWDDQYVTETITDAEAVLEKGNVVTPEKTHQEKRFVKAAGDVWTVRYEEALALETAYQRWRLSKIEAALQAKGITL